MKSLKEQLLEALDLQHAKEYTNLSKDKSEEIIALQKYFFNRVLELYKDAFLSRNGYRLYLPYTLDSKQEASKDEQISKIEQDVLSTLQNNGYYIKDKDDYIKNKCYKKIVTQRGEKEVQYNIAKVLKDKELKDAFASDPNRDRSKNDNKCYLCFSTHGYDIAGMSTNRDWTSCMDIIDGCNKKYVKADIKYGTIICYLINKDDMNINKPLCRVLIKPRLLDNNKDNIIYYPEVSVYGIQGYLSKSLIEYLEELCNNVYINKKGELNNFSVLYNDVHNMLKTPKRYLNSTFKREPIKANNNNIAQIVYEAVEKFGDNTDLNFIDVSGVTNMRYLFDRSKFNGDISKWDVSNVTDMQYMFADSAFAGDISKWNVSNVTDMSSMFRMSQFNGDISKWDVSNVTDMQYMFANSAFAGDISKWDVSNVTDMQYMFAASVFNGDISKWNVKNVKDMSYMFVASVFNGDISNWNVENVKDMSYMFRMSQFNGDISKWDVSNVTDMSSMFRMSQFNGDISKWDVSNVNEMDFMFKECKFNGDISKWNVSKVENMRSMFKMSQFNGDISKWDVSNVTNMEQMFKKSKFNGDISKWDVLGVKEHYEFCNGSPLEKKPDWQPKFKK